MSPPSDPVRVTVSASGNDVVLAVSNRGPAIPPALLPVIFEPFRRGAAQESTSGLGLGLFIASQIVHAHHGALSVSSSVESGTVFTARIPRVPSGDPNTAR